MRIPKLLILQIVLFLFGAAFAAAQASSLSAGTIVAAKWSDGAWYRGKISAVKDDRYSVLYDDGDVLTMGRADLRMISMSPSPSKGQKVFALWKNKKILHGNRHRGEVE